MNLRLLITIIGFIVGCLALGAGIAELTIIVFSTMAS